MLGKSGRAIQGLVFALSAFFAVSCATRPPSAVVPLGVGRIPSPAPRAQALSVVLFTVDGARWQEVFHGVDGSPGRGGTASPRSRPDALMPNLHRLARDGGLLFGAPGAGGGIFASGPEFVSLPGYAEMLSGRRVSGCADNGCRAASAPTLADDVASAPGARVGDVAIVTSWPDIGRIAAQRAERVAMSTGRNGGPTRELFREDPVSRALVDEGARSRAEPGAGDFRPDRLTAQIAVRYLELERPRFLFVSLGEPDEYAHRGDYAGYLRALRRADLAIGAISRALHEHARQGSRTVLLVTADHGRASDFVNHGRKHPESARVWLMAWGTEVSSKPFVPAGASYLADLAPTLRALFGLPEDRHPAAGRPLVAVFEERAR
ncbi:MAG TPA: alkaline phosphatase family protein [Polyangiaceae bacterium]